MWSSPVTLTRDMAATLRRRHGRGAEPEARKATDERQEHPRLAGHVGAHVPRVGLWEQRVAGKGGDLLRPLPLRLLRRLDRRQLVLAEVGDAARDPVHVLLDRP